MRLQGFNLANNSKLYSQHRQQPAKSVAFGATIDIVDNQKLLDDEKFITENSGFFAESNGDSMAKIKEDLKHRLDAEGTYKVEFKTEKVPKHHAYDNFGNPGGDPYIDDEKSIKFTYENKKVPYSTDTVFEISNTKYGTLTERLRNFIASVEKQLRLIQEGKDSLASLHSVVNAVKEIR